MMSHFPEAYDSCCLCYFSNIWFGFRINGTVYTSFCFSDAIQHIWVL